MVYCNIGFCYDCSIYIAYVILKPPFLSEQEAITEAISTIGFANEIGFERISLEPMTIHGYTSKRLERL